MWGNENVITKNVGRTNRNLLVVNVVVLGFLVLIAVCSWRATYNLMFGPWKTTHEALLKIDPSKDLQYNVLVDTQDKITEPIYEEFSIRKDKAGNEKSRSTTALYQLLAINGGRILLVKSPGGVGGKQLSGGLVSIPDNLQTECLDVLESKEPSLKGRFMPYMLDTTRFDGWGYFPLVLQIPVFLLCVWKLISLRARTADPSKHPIMKAIKNYGDPREVSAAIEDDMRMSNGGKRKGLPGLWSSQWLLVPTTFDLLIGKLDDLVWLYAHETKHSVNFIPTGSTWKLMMHFADKRAIEIDTNKQNVEKLLVELIQRVPWAYAGFSEDLKGWWQKQPQVMIEESAKARREMSVKTAPPPDDYERN